jgi:hypothetical protein
MQIKLVLAFCYGDIALEVIVDAYAVLTSNIRTPRSISGCHNQGVKQHPVYCEVEQ